MSPPIHLFLTTIASQPLLRKRQEYILRILQAKKIPFTSYDLASDADAKRLWRRKAPADKQQLPGILVGYQFVGTFDAFEEAVEYNELDIFLKLKEPWDPAIDEERPPPEAKPVGVPGANLPMEMAPKHIQEHIRAEQSPLRVKSKTKPIPVNKIDEKDKIDLGAELGHGLEGLKVTQDELLDLMGQLGLGGEEADDLAQGLVGTSSSSKKVAEEKPSTEKKVEEAKDNPEDVKGKAKAVQPVTKEDPNEVAPTAPIKVEDAGSVPAKEAESKGTLSEKEVESANMKDEKKEISPLSAPAPTSAEVEGK